MMVIAVAATLILYAYWYTCRATALDEKEKLSKITIDYLNDDTAPSKMKDMAYFSYLGAGKWWFFLLYASLPLSYCCSQRKNTRPHQTS